MKPYVSALLVVLSMAFPVGCGAVMIIGSEEWFTQAPDGREALAKRASFELSCPREQLQFVCVGPESRCNPVGVSGCNQKAVYRVVDFLWAIDSTQQPEGATQPPAGAVPQPAGAAQQPASEW